jgi:hypothetical protein
LKFIAYIFILLLICCRSTHDNISEVENHVPDSSVADASFEASQPKKIANRRILIVGDSEACAVSWQLKNAKLPKLDVVEVECKGGTVVPYWGSQGNLKKALDKRQKFDIVIIFLGTNHYGQVVTPKVEPILDIVKERGLRCVWVGNTSVNGKKWKINHLIRDAVTPTCQYFDTEQASIPLPDGVHPDGSGAIKWLNLIWEMLPITYEDSDE